MSDLPVGIQTFREIIEEGYRYVDKTGIAHNLITNNKYTFLSRPRRFGKSLFLDTLRNIFEGNRSLFEGLEIYKQWDWETKYPVIKISFSGGIYNLGDLSESLFSSIDKVKDQLGIESKSTTSVNVCFGELIRDAYKKHNQRVVILVDEYDKPILDNLSNPDQAEELRNGLRDFYTQIKDNDEYIKFAFLTGVSKFSRTSIFSGLNNITDISLNPEYGNICGYTQNDLETVFASHLEGVDMEKLKLWYNGYNFLGDLVYNPYGILLFLKNSKVFSNYWFESGTPSFLIELIKKNKYFIPNFNDLAIGKNMVESFDIRKLSLETIMFQTGYLTIKSIKNLQVGVQYILGYPNIEVANSFNNYILNLFVSDYEKDSLRFELYEILESASLEKLEAVIKQLFASIAYNNFTNNEIDEYEGFYASVLYAYFSSLGVKIVAEDVTNYGRIDLSLIVNDSVYIFEFKMDGGDPLKQIKERRYFEKYLSADTDVEVYIIGIVFDADKRNVTDFQCERV